MDRIAEETESQINMGMDSSCYSLQSVHGCADSSRRLFSCKQLRPRRTLSEASVYRANSRYSLNPGVSQENKALDRLMHCFWLCSPGCQQTA